MADINFSNNPASDAMKPEGRSPGPRAGEIRWDIIELLFFAYRDFVGDADHELEAFGFGRAHHRVLHFVHRYPGLKVADLLDVLRITKQSLGRVLKQLLDEGYIVQKTGNNDRRQRLLFATAKGEALVGRLAGLQTTRINRALADLAPDDAETVRRFLRAMIDRDDPDKVLEPIFMLTARHEAESRIEGLQIGADDYVAKPFEPRELALRIGNILKRSAPPPVATLEQVAFGPYVFHLERGELRIGEEIIHLTDREREMLRILSVAPGETVPRAALTGNGAVNERAVDVQINRLRRKIERDPANPLFLQAVRGIGYRLVASP